MSISQMAHNVARRPKQGKPGMPGFLGAALLTLGFFNSAPQAAQVDTFTITGATNAKDYTVVINGVSVTFTSGGAATTTTIAAGLAAAINAEPRVRAIAAAAAAVAVVTVTAIGTGIVYVLSEADAEITLASVTAAAEADAVPFGRAVMQTGYESDVGLLGTLAVETRFAAQVDVVTATHEAAVAYHLDIYYNDAHASGSVVAGVDQAATRAAVRGALDDMIASSGAAVATSDGGAAEVVVTANQEGDSFRVEISAIGGAPPAVGVVSNRSTGTSLVDSWLGVSRYSCSVETDLKTAASPEYPANAGGEAVEQGSVWVANSEGVSYGETVFVDLAPGATAGTFSNVVGGKKVPLPKSRARWLAADRDGASGSIAQVEILK